MHTAGGNVAAFHSPHAHNMLRAITCLSDHTPSQAPPLSLLFIKRLCDIFPVSSPEADTVRTALLLGYTSFVMQSNLLRAQGRHSTTVFADATSRTSAASSGSISTLLRPSSTHVSVSPPQSPSLDHGTVRSLHGASTCAAFL